MKITIKGKEYGYRAYRDSNSEGDMWVAAITTIDGINLDRSGKAGYFDFSEDSDGLALYQNTKSKLYKYIDTLALRNALYVVFDNS